MPSGSPTQRTTSGIVSARPRTAPSPWDRARSDEHGIEPVAVGAGSIVVTSNRGPDEWLATFADPLRAQSAIDRFVNNVYDLVIEGESYRRRQKPTLDTSPASQAHEGPPPPTTPRKTTRTRTRKH